MGNWLYRATILGFWLVAMGWLVYTKILPPMLTGTAPTYRQILPTEAKEEPTVRWEILWNETRIGSATTEITRRADGTGMIASLVSFRDLAVSDLMSNFLGGAGRLFRPALQIDDNLRANVDLKSKTMFDHFGDLLRFDTAVSIDGVTDLLELRGVANNGKITVLVRLGDPSIPTAQRELFKQSFEVPANGLVSDSLAPSSRLTHLKVGQTWTLRVYNPLSPTNPMEAVQAKVESRDTIQWSGKLLRANLVVYRRHAGSGISAAREPIARMWVTRDGTVVRQEAAIGNGKIVFERVASENSVSPSASRDAERPVS